MSTRKKDEGFTNIRIRGETREELRAIGKYGENMDDIVRKCLAAYRAITSSGGRVVSKIVVEEPIKEQSQNTQTQQSQTPYDKALTPTGDNYHTIFRINLPGISKLKFPIHRHDLLIFSRQGRNDEKGDFGLFNFAIEERIPESHKTYKNIGELERDLMTVFNNDMKEKGIPKVITKCIIVDLEFRKNQEQFLEEQRARKKFTSHIQKAE